MCNAQAKCAPSGLLQRATAQWQTAHPDTPFGPTKFTATPAHWAKQCLGLNLVSSLAQHTLGGLARLHSAHHSQQHQPQGVLWQTLYGGPPAPYVLQPVDLDPPDSSQHLAHATTAHSRGTAGYGPQCTQ